MTKRDALRVAVHDAMTSRSHSRLDDDRSGLFGGVVRVTCLDCGSVGLGYQGQVYGAGTTKECAS